ncbi:hypothetical protein SRB5_47720 [Streptomyces sp. RB5]|uniref:3-octaprenyl-4-hydroxybenzoate carboxy-lyase n=1 Tax=Streptomyces smaragdinus TaxID=2585196 RepID=A0A7K0CPD2_9ACTN|nr:suppressor of fused domain protein [Streptomyces smaragdinus]MQY14604.1 hypothetical protein [Streptomyces smaragdinus]
MTESLRFPEHVFDALGVDPMVQEDLIGGMIRVVVKRPATGPITLMTAGASRLPTDSGERVELAVEVIEGQLGAARIALQIVCDDMATNRRVPPFEAPWRNSDPFLTGTRISAIMATGSRWGASFDDVLASDGTVLGHVRTLRLLTDAEAAVASAYGWDALVKAAGSLDALLDVTREDAVEGGGIPDNAPVILSKLHDEHPPRWVTYSGSELQSLTGLESDEYMDNADNHELWAVSSFVARFPHVAEFVRKARPGQTALFTDASGAYTLEDD